MKQTVIKDVLVDVEYSENLHDFHNHLPFLPEKMEINKCEKLVWVWIIKITTFETNKH